MVAPPSLLDLEDLVLDGETDPQLARRLSGQRGSYERTSAEFGYSLRNCQSLRSQS